MKRSNADKLFNAVDSQKHEIKLLLEPTKQSAGIIKESTITNSNEKKVQNEYYIIKKDQENNVEIYPSNAPGVL